MRLLAVDPGVRACGWAYFETGNKSLLGCGLARSKEPGDMLAFDNMIRSLPGRACLLVERPQLYRQSKSKGDPEDLARLLILCGMLAAERPHDTHLIKPRQWKGTVPKTNRLADYVIHKRNMRRWGSDYLFLGIPGSLAHNVADAVGLGTWWIDTRG